MNTSETIKRNRKAIAVKPGDWEEVDWIDIYPGVGSFVSPVRNDYEIHGRTINALNFVHAQYLWAQQVVEESNEVFGVCCHCNHAIRYAVIFKDGNGNHHMVGQSCAAFIGSALDPAKYAEKRLASSVEKISTKQGERYVIRTETPSWFWDIPRDQRPKFASTSKWDRPGKKSVWYLTVWGDNAEETISNWEALQNIRKSILGVA